MAKLTLSDPSNLINSSATATLAANNRLVEAALENTLSRDGTSPNTMEADIDMGSNRLYNLPEPTSNTEPIRRIDLTDSLPGIFVQDTEPSTSEPEGSLWIDSDSADNDLYQLTDSVWTDTTVNLQGDDGANGSNGSNGANGTAATITVGTVDDVAYGMPATVTNSGTSGAAILDFEIPAGPTGEAGVATFYDQGTETTGTITIDRSLGEVHRVQVGGNITLAFSNWATAGTYSEILLEIVNGGAHTITWPTLTWLTSGGTPPSLAASGTDFVVVFTRDGGTTLWAVASP
jgi:hypothetical protein